MTCKTQQIVDLLEIALRTIRIDSGYQSDIGLAVYQGFYVLALRSPDIRYPFIALQPDTEQVDEIPQGSTKAKVTASTQIIVATDYSAEASQVLRCALDDVRRALVRHIDTALAGIGIRQSLRFGTAEYALSTDANLSLAALPVSVSFVENYEE